jgi:hypothetical protein
MRSLVAVAAVVILSACASPSPGPAVTGPADVAVSSGDVPHNMVRCDGSGDIDTFLNSIKTREPSTYSQTVQEWQDAKNHGATSAQVVFYADSKDHCASIQSSNNNLGTAAYPVVLNFVIKFKDEKSAQDGYTNGSIFGFSESSLSGMPVASIVKGKDTGLSDNSITLTVPIGNQTFYVAVWQNKAFMVILAAVDLGADGSKKIATSVNGRIR